ncbi:MAG: antitoxin VapB family protein [Methanosarcinaceae archaeon]|nr:antitoxin VapB family protein [Methanosarcinaceae archaeon]
MKSKTITISDHAYNILKRRRHQNETFDDAIVRMEHQLSRKKASVEIMNFAGVLSERSAVEITHAIEELRTKVDREFIEQTKKRSA